MSSSPHQRAQRVGQLIHEVLGQLLIEGLKDPRVGFVTITHVHLTDDLRSAWVAVSILGSDSQRQTSLQGLQAAAGYLKRHVAQHLKLRFTPDLRFSLDDSLDRVQRLEELFAAVSRGETDIPAEKGPQAYPKVQTGRELMPIAMPLPPSTHPKKSRGHENLSAKRPNKSRRKLAGSKIKRRSGQKPS